MRSGAPIPESLGRQLDILYAGTLPPHTGGSAMLAGDMLSGLACRGHRVRAVAPMAAAFATQLDPYVRADPQIAVTRVVVPFFDGSPDVAASPAYREREERQVPALLHALIGERRPDVVVAGRESFAPYVAEVAAAHGLPSTLLIQGTTLFGILRGTMPEPLAASLLAQFRAFDLVIVVARHLARAIAGFGCERVVIIENCVDTGLFHPAPKAGGLMRELGIGSGEIVVAHVSNMKPLKRVDDIAASAREALQCDSRLLYVIVGDGSDRKPMERACAQAGVAERFRFVGWVARERIPDYLNLADVVVMTSAAEARALVYLETQACGRVLLASDIPSAHEAVTDDEDGLLFALGDVADLTAKTLRASGDPVLRARLGANARATALTRPLPAMVEAYEDAFRSVVRR